MHEDLKGKHILVKPNEEGSFDIHVGDMVADRLGPDEAIGLLSALINTDRCLGWLRTPEQIKAWNDKYRNNER